MQHTPHTHVSELIRVAADDRQREERHRLVLQQLRHLCRLIQQPHLQQPEEQMAAVAAHVKQVCVGKVCGVFGFSWQLYVQ